MADGVSFQTSTLATPASGTEIATDDAGGDGHVQIIKLAISTDGSATVIPATTADGLLVNLGANNDVTFAAGAEVKITDGTDDLAINTAGSAAVDPRPTVTRIQVSQTTTATAYEAKDAIGGLMTFANAARTSGGSIHVESVTIVDEDQQLAAVDLVLFRASITAPTDEAAFDPTDAELLDCIGVVKFTSSDYSDFNDNAVAHKDVALSATLSGTSLYGVLVARGTPTYASTSSVHVTVTLVQD